MTELLSTYLEPILAFISGGGLFSVISMKYSKKQAEANAMKAVQEVYQSTIKDLRDTNDYLKIEISTLRETVSQNTKDISLLKRYKCTVLDCNLRKTE